MDLKYLTSTQTVEVKYEGQKRRFSVSSISSQQSTSGESFVDLTHGLGTLSIDSRPQLWTVGWDSAVLILGNEVDDKTQAFHKVSWLY